MGTPHKHAEVLKAIADGKSVEWQGRICNGCWHEGTDTFNPIDDWELDWRIKPEPKPDVVRNFFFEPTHQTNGRWYEGVSSAGNNMIVTFDGETGKLKSAEVIS